MPSQVPTDLLWSWTSIKQILGVGRSDLLSHTSPTNYRKAFVYVKYFAYSVKIGLYIHFHRIGEILRKCQPIFLENGWNPTKNGPVNSKSSLAIRRFFYARGGVDLGRLSAWGRFLGFIAKKAYRFSSSKAILYSSRICWHFIKWVWLFF